MSSTLYITRNIFNEKATIGFKQPIKGIIARKFYDHDGSLGGGFITIGPDYLDWFEGVLAAYPRMDDDERDLQKIVNILREGDSLDMWFEN